jgi:hypothetical protein
MLNLTSRLPVTDIDVAKHFGLLGFAKVELVVNPSRDLSRGVATWARTSLQPFLLGHFALSSHGAGTVTATATQLGKCPFRAAEQAHAPGDFVWARGMQSHLTQPAAALATRFLDSSGERSQLIGLNGNSRTIGQYRAIIEPAGKATSEVLVILGADLLAIPGQIARQRAPCLFVATGGREQRGDHFDFSIETK